MAEDEKEVPNPERIVMFDKALKALPGEKIHCPICNEEILPFPDAPNTGAASNVILHVMKKIDLGEHNPEALTLVNVSAAGILDEYKTDLQKEKEKSLRLQADYQNLEKQTIDRINTRGNKIILDFLTVYEDFIRAKDAYEKEGGNVDSLNGIIKNMETILDHYEVKPIEAEGKKLDPKLHEVVQEIEDNDHEEGTIVKEITKGYIIRGEVMKYSKVCVSKKLIKK